jgi:hypothetical protein
MTSAHAAGLREYESGRFALFAPHYATKSACPLLCRFLGHRDGMPVPGLGPMSEKRQGTKSRDVGRRRCRRLYGDCIGPRAST